MLRLRRILSFSVTMVFVNSAATQGRRSCRNLASVIFSTVHSQTPMPYFRLKMRYRVRKKSRWKFCITKKMVSAHNRSRETKKFSVKLWIFLSISCSFNMCCGYSKRTVSLWRFFWVPTKYVLVKKYFFMLSYLGAWLIWINKGQSPNLLSFVW